MTLIGAFSVNDFPVVFGDALTSGSGLVSDGVKLPTIGEVNGRLSSDYGFGVDLCQKVNILGPNHVAAWAGSYVQARSAFRELRELLDHEDDDGSLIPDYFEQLPYRDQDDLSILALYPYKGQTQLYYRNAETAVSTQLMNIRLAGTGAPYARKFMDRFSSVPLPQLEPGIPPVASVLGSSLIFASQAMGRELLSGGNLLEKWGGAVEIAWMTHDGVQKLDKVVYLTLSCEVAHDILRISMIPHIIKAEYHGSILVCRTVRLKSEGGKNIILDDQVVPIPPLGLRSLTNLTAGLRPSLDYKVLCTYVRVERAAERPWSFSLVDFCGGGAKPAQIVELGSEIEFELGDRLLQRIQRGVVDSR